MLFVQLSEYTKTHGIACFTRGSLMVGELVLNIAVIFKRSLARGSHQS